MSKVSVVIPCYNHGAFLPDTLDSVRQQTFRDYEILVVNDGSTDAETVRLLRQLDQPGLRVIHTANSGVSAARNRGIAEARGDYILPLDADDLIGPEYLEKAVNLLDSDGEIAVVFCERIMFGEEDGIKALPEYEQRAMLVNNLIYPAALFRKEDWKRAGGYCEKMVYGWEDWDFWIALTSTGGRVVKLPDPLFYYRVRSSSRDHSLTWSQKFLMFALMVFRHRRSYAINGLYVFRRLLLDRAKKGVQDATGL